MCNKKVGQNFNVLLGNIYMFSPFYLPLLSFPSSLPSFFPFPSGYVKIPPVLSSLGLHNCNGIASLSLSLLFLCLYMSVCLSYSFSIYLLVHLSLSFSLLMSVSLFLSFSLSLSLSLSLSHTHYIHDSYRCCYFQVKHLISERVG